MKLGHGFLTNCNRLDVLKIALVLAQDKALFQVKEKVQFGGRVRVANVFNMQKSSTDCLSWNLI